MGPLQVPPFRIRVDLGVIVIKVYSILHSSPKASQLVYCFLSYSGQLF